jgi:hypothetical protein
LDGDGKNLAVNFGDLIIGFAKSVVVGAQDGHVQLDRIARIGFTQIKFITRLFPLLLTFVGFRDNRCFRFSFRVFIRDIENQTKISLAAVFMEFRKSYSFDG